MSRFASTIIVNEASRRRAPRVSRRYSPGYRRAAAQIDGGCIRLLAFRPFRGAHLLQTCMERRVDEAFQAHLAVLVKPVDLGRDVWVDRQGGPHRAPHIEFDVLMSTLAPPL